MAHAAVKKSNAAKKPGRYGMLYLFVIKYEEKSFAGVESGMGEQQVRLWAYNRDQVIEEWYENESHEGWEIVSVEYAPKRKVP